MSEILSLLVCYVNPTKILENPNIRKIFLQDSESAIDPFVEQLTSLNKLTDPPIPPGLRKSECRLLNQITHALTIRAGFKLVHTQTRKRTLLNSP